MFRHEHPKATSVALLPTVMMMMMVMMMMIRQANTMP